MAASSGSTRGGREIVQRISLAGAEEVKRLLEQMGTQGEKAAAQIGRAMAVSGGDTAKLGAAVEGAFVKIGQSGAALKPLQNELAAVNGGLGRVGGTLGELTSVLLPNFTSKLGLGLVGAAVGLKELLTGAKNSITEMKNLSIETGLSINAIQSIKDVFEDQGVPVEKLSTVIGKFSEELGKARLEAQKLEGPLGSPFAKASEKVTTLRGDLNAAGAAASDAGVALHGAAQQVRDTSTAFGSLQMDANVLKRFPDTVKGNFQALVEFSRRLGAVKDDTERARIGAQMFGRQWRTEAAGILALADRLEEAMSERVAKGLAINPDEIKRTDEYRKAVHDLGDQWERVEQVIGTALFPVLTSLAARTEESVQNMRETIAAFGNLATATWEAIRRSYGTEIDGIVAATTTGLETLKSLMQGYYNFQVGFWASVFQLGKGYLDNLVGAATTAFQWIIDKARALSEAPAPEYGPPVPAAIRHRGAAPVDMPAGADFGGDFSPRPFWGDPNEVRPIEAINPDFAGGLARGGQVPGSGSGDSVPAWLTPKEYVVKVAAVRKYGVDFMRRLNAMQVPKYAMGGLVDGLGDVNLMGQQHFARGGLVRGAAGGGGSPVHLHLDGQAFELRGAGDVVEGLTRAAVRRNLLSTGRRPGWVGA